MQSTLRCSRAIGVGRFVVTAVATLGSALLVAEPLRAQSAATQRSVGAPGTGEWARCAPSGDPTQDEQAADGAGQARLIVRGDSMSLEARGCTLTEVLSLIAERTAIRVAVSEAVASSRRSWRTPLQPIEATLREVLRDTDIFVRYAADSQAGAAPRLDAVWVYPRGSTDGIEPVPVEQWASTHDLQRQLTEWSPELRGRAIEELIARGGDTALPQVFEALSDGDGQIRQRALDAALAAGLDVPLPQLQTLALDDPSPEVRLRALQALEERPDSAATIEAATHDSDANVRREAQNIVRRTAQPAR